MKSVPQLLELPAQFQVIVNFSVKDNRGVAVIGNDGLVSALQVDNFQARRAHRKNARSEHSALIGSAMGQCSGSVFYALRFGPPIFMCKPGYSAQIRAPFASQRMPLALQPLLPPRSTRKTAPRQDTSPIPKRPAPLPRTPARPRPSAQCSPLRPKYISRQRYQPRSSKRKRESQS